MPEPKKHYEQRGWIESVLRNIPGFRGYLEQEYRRESDELQRTWLADRLQRSKRGLDRAALALTDQGAIDILPQVDRLRSRIDKLIGRIRTAWQGYSGFFDLVQIDEGQIDRVYEHDVALMERTAALAEAVEAFPAEPAAAQERVAALMTQIEEIEDAWDHREDILKGLE